MDSGGNPEWGPRRFRLEEQVVGGERGTRWEEEEEQEDCDEYDRLEGCSYSEHGTISVSLSCRDHLCRCY